MRRHRPHPPLLFTALIGVSVPGVIRSARAMPPLAPNGMPGIHHLGLSLPVSAPLAACAATLGYGYTEPQGAGDSSHHRQMARLGVALWPVRWLGVSLRLDERYDLHPGGGGASGSDDGFMVDPTISIRSPWQVSNHVHLGPELSAWLPAAGSVGTSFESATTDARLLATMAYPDVTAGLALGYRLDRSGNAGREASRMRSGDRLALALSDFDSVTLAAGGAYAMGRSTIEAEVSADLLIGSGAPPLSQSPLRAAAGVEQRLSPTLTLQALLEVGLSARPPAREEGALIPIEPRIAGFVGLRYQVTSGPRDALPAEPPTANAPAPLLPASTNPGTSGSESAPFEIHLTDEDSQPILDANATLEVGGEVHPLMNVGRGTYRNDRAPMGSGNIHIEVDGAAPIDRPITIGPSPQALDLKAAPRVSSQVRGLVRSMQGTPLRATIRIEPSGTEAKTDAGGLFEIDVEPGAHDVVIEAPGFRAQRRHVNVQKRGVVVINADLAKGTR